MTNEQLAVALQELSADVAAIAERVDHISQRVYDLETAEERRYQADQELSAHLNGMTYP